MSTRQTEGGNTCERCGQVLYGHLGVLDATFGEVTVVAIRETSPRNWICCDACSALLCHDCCQEPQSGYCDQCLSKLNQPDQDAG